jgi:CheY-like chemotaxis protein
MVKAFGDLQDDISKMLSDAENASLRAKHLTQQLLTFAKGGQPNKKPVTISMLIKNTVEFALSGSRTRHELLIPDRLWLAEGDEGQIGRVIQNLIINADQAMPRGGTVRICAENVVIGEMDALPLKKGRYLKISIADEGTGIDKKDLQNIFDPFFTTKQTGSGLGLTIAYSIVNNHDGHLGVDSELGVGTTFDIYLPASHRTSTEEEREESSPIKGEGKILVIDDEENIRRSASEVLKRLGYEVRVARDHSEGIELYEEAEKENKPFDVVIMDLTIRGGMGGKEAIKKFKKVDRNVKAIASSGYSDDRVMSNFKEYGFSGFVAKPYTINDLSTAIHQVLKGTPE